MKEKEIIKTIEALIFEQPISLPDYTPAFIQEYGVKYKGEFNSILNPNLIKKQGVDKEGVKLIKTIHVMLLTIFDEIEKEDDPDKLHVFADVINELDFKLQEAWGFERDANYHTWWYRAPKCTCPTMDNQERVGTPYSIVSEDCPLHGKIV